MKYSGGYTAPTVDAILKSFTPPASKARKEQNELIRQRTQCTVGVLVLALAATAEADGERDAWLSTPRAEATRVAVLEWCEAREGDFHITNSRPFCVASDPELEMPVLFMGEWRMFAVVDPVYCGIFGKRSPSNSVSAYFGWLIRRTPHSAMASLTCQTTKWPNPTQS